MNTISKISDILSNASTRLLIVFYLVGGKGGTLFEGLTFFGVDMIVNDPKIS